MRIVCIGDSITFGEHVVPHLTWPMILQAKYKQHRFVQKGICGDTTRLGLERFPRDVQDQQPDAVLIQFGLNDCNQWETDRGHSRVSPVAYHANLLEMISRSRTFGAKHVFVLNNHPTQKPKLESWSAVYSGLADDAAYAASANFIDIRGWFLSFTPDTLALMIQEDLVHLTAQGHARYALGVDRHLKEILQ